jgi:hypothetical protein
MKGSSQMETVLIEYHSPKARQKRLSQISGKTGSLQINEREKTAIGG